MKRSRNIMLRLSEEEYEELLVAKPVGDDLATFVRKAALSATAPAPLEIARRAAAFTVAALSQEITFEEALLLFDEYVAPNRKEVADGGSGNTE